VSWKPYPSNNLKLYKIKIESYELRNTADGNFAIKAQPVIKHYDIHNPEYFFTAERNRGYIITVDAYNNDLNLLGSSISKTFTNRIDCPDLAKPSCASGEEAYYPPAADGCLGPPVCKPISAFADQPKAGYEDIVIERAVTAHNPFVDNS